MARLIHLNGPPGIGKSTPARRCVVDHSGVFNCDIDVLRTLIGGREDDSARAGALIRPPALAMISAYPAEGHDVVLPQMLFDSREVARFSCRATDVGAEFVETYELLCASLRRPRSLARTKRSPGARQADLRRKALGVRRPCRCIHVCRLVRCGRHLRWAVMASTNSSTSCSVVSKAVIQRTSRVAGFQS